MTLILEQKVKVHLEQLFRQVQCAYTNYANKHTHTSQHVHKTL